MSKKIANMVFPNLEKTWSDYELLYPIRKDGAAACTVRFAPSPTGFMHIGGLYTALINSVFAHRNNGVFLLRIEDTDQKRLVEDGVQEIIDTLKDFNIVFDEGSLNETEEYGAYGPYRQSQRREIYQAYAKCLIEQGKAYPCFCSEEDLQQLREEQTAKGALQIGYYGEWANCRALSEDEILSKISSGQAYIIRLRSPGSNRMRNFADGLRGTIAMPENQLDAVIIKGDGLPTYHFAHAIDDHLMRTTHVIRADEWLSSLPLHVQLFEMLDFALPEYIHLSPIVKLEQREGSANPSRRKLSKRKDPEARVHYYDEAGYPVEAVLDYLLTISSADYEPWRVQHMDTAITEFPLNITQSGLAGAQFDFQKLNSVSRNRIAHMGNEEISEHVLKWADKYDKKLSAYISSNPSQFHSSVHLWHDKRLDVAKWSDLIDLYPYLYDEDYRNDYSAMEEILQGHMERTDLILREYLGSFCYADDASIWFGKIRTLAETVGYAASVAAYKKNSDAYLGSIVDIAGIIRYVITGQTNTPDLYGIIHIIGEEEMRSRIDRFLSIANARSM